MHFPRILALNIIFLSLAACAGTIKSGCSDANWHQLGYESAVAGNTNLDESLANHTRRCEAQGTAVNKEQYANGHADGMVQFCQLSSAVELGVKGKRNVIDQQICSDSDYPGFSQAFANGYRLYELRLNVKQHGKAISDLNRQINAGIRDRRLSNRSQGSGGLTQPPRSGSNYNRQGQFTATEVQERRLAQLRRRQQAARIEANNYAEGLYQDYLPNLDTRFIDPRETEPENKQVKQNEFDQRIDELLNE